MTRSLTNVNSISYAATRGLLWSHMGWILYKPNYERMNLIDAKDLDTDKGEHPFIIAVRLRLTESSVVRMQHKYYGELST